MVVERGQTVTRPTTREASYWQALQIYPDAIAHPEAKERFEGKAVKLLADLRIGNLTYICEELGVVLVDGDELPQGIASRLIQSESSRLLIYLAEFLRTRVTSVVEHFDSRFPESVARKIQARIDDKAGGHGETLKPFTKLLAIYLWNSTELESIHYRFAWRRNSTLIEYDIPGSLPERPSQRLEGSIGDLITGLNAIKPGESFVTFGTNELQTGLHVFVLHRNYPTAVRPDYRNRFRFQHDSSRIVFGLDTERSALVIKVANQAISKAISSWVRETLSVDLVSAGGSIYSNYDSRSVARNFMGSYDESHGVDLIAIEFKYSSLPGGSPITISAAEYSRGIRDELGWLHEQGVLKLTSLADLKSLTVRYGDVATQILVDVERGGAVLMRPNDAGLAEDHIAGLKRAFERTFLVPLGQRIDPTMMVMGATEIYHYLLSGVEEQQVRSYQREHFFRLVDKKLLRAVDVKIGRCMKLDCINNLLQLTDPAIVECPACQSSIKWEERRRYVHDQKEISVTAKTILQKAMKWKLSTNVKRFEGYPFYKLSAPASPNKMIYVFLNDRLTSVKTETFQRTMFPILVIHPTGDQRAPTIDVGGIAHVSFPYALAALDDTSSWLLFCNALRRSVQSLLKMEHERVCTSSRVSRELLVGKPPEYDDRKFEADVYNILRCLFPYSIRWGGANKPDGFCSLIHFENNDLSHPLKFNMSYDAKFSERSYQFGIAEYRQMFDYINSLGQSQWLKTEGNRYDGHMIISNSINESSMKNAADFLWSSHRLAKDRPNFLLVFVLEGFLVKLWDLVHENSTEISKRWLIFPEKVVAAIRDKNSDGFSLLDDDAAASIVKDLLRQPPIENPINHEFLLNDLSHLISKRSRIRKGRKRASPN